MISSGHVRELQRAHEHLEWIGAYLKPWIEGNKHSHWLEPDDIPSQIRVMARLSEQPAEYPLSVVLGEFLHNMRSALDLLTYELACAYTKPLPDDVAESSEFPIFGDEDRQGNGGVGHGLFSKTDRSGSPARGSGFFKIRGMDPRAQTRIEGLQPYKRGADFRRDPLWMLHELDRINKHRLLHIVAAAGVFQLRVDPGHDQTLFPFVGTIQSFSGMNLGKKPAKVGILSVRPDFREDQVKVHPEAAVYVLVDNVPTLADELSFNGPPALDSLASIYNHVVSVVLPNLTPYF
jgi:hypothetical protein